MTVLAALSVSTANHWWQTPRDKRAIEQELGSAHRYVDVDEVRFPPTMPALSLLAFSSLAVEPEWEAAHRVAIADPEIQRFGAVGEHHYLFRADADVIADAVERFLDEYLPAG